MPLSVYFLDPGDIWLAKWYSNYVLNNQLFSKMLVAMAHPCFASQKQIKAKLGKGSPKKKNSQTWDTAQKITIPLTPPLFGTY